MVINLKLVGGGESSLSFHFSLTFILWSVARFTVVCLDHALEPKKDMFGWFLFTDLAV
jgi:hypothetical protein